jgi:hypothetical protein
MTTRVSVLCLTMDDWAVLRRLARPDLFSEQIPDELARRFMALGYARQTAAGLVITDLGRKSCRTLRGQLSALA